MKLKELIIYLNTAQQKLGLDAEVFVASILDDEDNEIKDIVMETKQSLVSGSDESKVIIKF